VECLADAASWRAAQILGPGYRNGAHATPAVPVATAPGRRGVGNSNCGLDYPNPTQPQSHPRDTRSTRPFHGASHGKPIARNTRSIESGS
jgi:hypothetical protein